MPIRRNGPRGELARASSTTTQSGISAATDLTGLSITFTVNARTVKVKGYIPAYQPSDTATGCNILIADGSNTVTASGTGPSTGATYAQCVAEERITTPGTYTRKLRAGRLGTGTIATVLGGTVGPAFIEAVEV